MQNANSRDPIFENDYREMVDRGFAGSVLEGLFGSSRYLR